MTLEQFITKYNGKFVEYHSYNPAALNQCADLANQYIVEVLGLPAIIGTNAQDFPSKANGLYDYILNTPTGVTLPGDIMIFKSADKVGHISIFVTGNANTFTSFDQNWPTGSPCKKVSHNYTNVLGWMRAKGNMNMYKGYDLSNADSMKVAVDVLVRLQSGELVEKSKLDSAQLDFEKQKNELNELVQGLRSNLEKYQKELAACKLALSSQPKDPQWEVNGKIVETTEGNTKTIINYKKV